MCASPERFKSHTRCVKEDVLKKSEDDKMMMKHIGIEVKKLDSKRSSKMLINHL